jgi:hypothetical protein
MASCRMRMFVRYRCPAREPVLTYARIYTVEEASLVTMVSWELRAAITDRRDRTMPNECSPDCSDVLMHFLRFYL